MITTKCGTKEICMIWFIVYGNLNILQNAEKVQL